MTIVWLLFFAGATLLTVGHMHWEIHRRVARALGPAAQQEWRRLSRFERIRLRWDARSGRGSRDPAHAGLAAEVAAEEKLLHEQPRVVRNGLLLAAGYCVGGVLVLIDEKLPLAIWLLAMAAFMLWSTASIPTLKRNLARAVALNGARVPR